MKHKHLIYISTLLLILIAGLILIPVKREINESFPCLVLDQQDESYTDQVTVIFSGTYTDYLLKQDIFMGKIDIEGHQFLHPESKDIEIKIGNSELSWITELSPIDYRFHTRGSFYGQEDFENFFLWLMVPDEEDPTSAHGRYFLTYPERTLEEIYEILS